MPSSAEFPYPKRRAEIDGITMAYIDVGDCDGDPIVSSTATRPRRAIGATARAPDAPLAEHGFAALVEVRKGDKVHRLLFDTGLTPIGCVDSLRRLGRDPGELEFIVCSHGHAGVPHHPERAVSAALTRTERSASPGHVIAG